MRSVGVIEERVNTQAGRLDLPPFAPSGTANSFFDVFFEIEVGGMVFHNDEAKRMEAVISHKPPAVGEEYEGFGEIPLLDEDNNPSGYSIDIVSHTPNPLPPEANIWSSDSLGNEKNVFVLGETVYATVTGGSGQTVTLYVVVDQIAWNNGAPLTDVSGDGAETETWNPGTQTIPIWTPP